MKTLFIHLSDIHLNEPFAFDKPYERLISSMKSQLDEADRVFLLFTGDMARKAKDEELCYFRDFMNCLIIEIREVFAGEVNALVIPGNHDIRLLNPYPLGKLLNGKPEVLDRLANDALADMNFALEVCRGFGCFADDPFISILNFETDSMVYRFTLVNSAPLAALKKKDKEHHRIPKSHLEFDLTRKFGKKTLDVFLSHHRPDWFDEETSFELKHFISGNISIAFFGHEHDPAVCSFGVNGRRVFVSRGGELLPKNGSALGSYALLMFDEESLMAQETVVNIDHRTGQTFYGETVSDPVETNELYPLQKDFSEWLFKSPLKSGVGSCFDFFVFPALSQQSIRNDLLSPQSAVSVAKTLGLVVLNGGTRSGKTMLLKSLFFESQKKRPCVFLKVNSELSNNPEKNVKLAFQEMYGDDSALWLRYRNTPKDEKAIFIDNFEAFRTRAIKESYLDYFRTNFGMVVMTYCTGGQPIESLEDKILFPEESVFKIEGLTVRSRKELIRRICVSEDVGQEYVDKICHVYEAMSASSKVLDFIDPDYAIQLIETIIDQKLYLERDTKDAFTVIFANSITNDIVRAGGENKTDDIFTLLRRIAYSIWKDGRGTITISEDEILACFSECKASGLIRIGFSDALEIIIKSGVIFKDKNDRYRFKRNSFLSFFVAKEIALKANRGKTDDIITLLTKIEQGLNSDILLFICYDQSKIDVIFQIKGKLEELLVGLEEIDFEKKSNAILRRADLIPEELEENKVTKIEATDRKERKERSRIKVEQDEEYNAFADLEMDEDFRQVLMAIKYSEIISKAAGSFPGLLEDDERKELVRSVVSSINKITQKLFDPTDDFIREFDSLVVEFKKVEEKRILAEGKGDVSRKINDLRSLRTVDILYGELLHFLTALDSIYANFSASRRSLPAIDDLPEAKFSYCVFKLYGYLYAGAFERFKHCLENAEHIFGSEKGDSIFQFFGRIYVLRNECSHEQINQISAITGISKDYLLRIASREDTLKIELKPKKKSQ